jgi:hypothetical protein
MPHSLFSAANSRILSSPESDPRTKIVSSKGKVLNTTRDLLLNLVNEVKTTVSDLGNPEDATNVQLFDMIEKIQANFEAFNKSNLDLMLKHESDSVVARIMIAALLRQSLESESRNSSTRGTTGPHGQGCDCENDEPPRRNPDKRKRY